MTRTRTRHSVTLYVHCLSSCDTVCCIFWELSFDQQLDSSQNVFPNNLCWLQT